MGGKVSKACAGKSCACGGCGCADDDKRKLQQEKFPKKRIRNKKDKKKRRKGSKFEISDPSDLQVCILYSVRAIFQCSDLYCLCV